MSHPSGLAVHGISKSFGAVHAVRGVNLEIAPGETVALLGPNGAGKSTTIDMLLGLQQPDAANVSLFGAAPRDAVRNGAVGAMLQTGGLIRELTVRELVTMIAALYPNPLAVCDVLALTGTREFADRRTHKLSGGETQRVRFAMAVVANPRLLVLDEPTVALDVEGRHDVWAIMRTFEREVHTTELFATHYLEEADAYADRVVLMARGTIVADGTPAAIKARVGQRKIRVTVEDADFADLVHLPGVTMVERQNGAATLVCEDSDVALRALLALYPLARDVEVRSAGLDEAFLELTSGHHGGVSRNEDCP
jgi:ABC-2 type transport system ATP-binding protein